MIHGGNDFALARLHARGNIPTEHWQQLAAARELRTVLERVRAIGAGRWVEGIGAATPAHAIEARLRERFGAAVSEIAGWADAAWMPALAWCQQLVRLPLLRQQLADDGARVPEGWTAIDHQAIRARGGLDLAAAWLAGLHRRLPALNGDDRVVLDRLLRLIEAHLGRFSQAIGNGWPEREALQRSLRARLRREPLSPVHLLTAVALLWLEHERVRGDLLRWAAMPGSAP